MKSIILSLFLITTTLLSFSQERKTEKPNYKTIASEILKEDSHLYYPKLMDRFKKADTTMTLEEKRHLYYGYIYQDGYSPYGRSNFNDSLRPLLKKPKLDGNDLTEFKRFSDSILVDKPFDFKSMNYQLFVYDELKDSESFNKTINKINILVDALLSSGDGESKKTAYYVIETSHEYFLLNVVGLKFGGTQSLIEHYDYLEVSENEAEIEGLYFDVSPCLESLSKQFGE